MVDDNKRFAGTFLCARIKDLMRFCHDKTKLFHFTLFSFEFAISPNAMWQENHRRRGEGGSIREGAFIRENTACCHRCPPNAPDINGTRYCCIEFSVVMKRPPPLLFTASQDASFVWNLTFSYFWAMLTGTHWTLTSSFLCTVPTLDSRIWVSGSLPSLCQLSLINLQKMVGKKRRWSEHPAWCYML